MNAHQAGPDALRLAASLGVGGIRVDGNWPDLQASPDQWTWDWLDTLLATSQSLGLQVYVSLAYTPSWLHPDRGSLPPLYDWQRFCLAFAQHFKGRLTFVGCWNEFRGSPEDYVSRVLRPMAETFRTVNPDYRICGPDLETERDWPERLRTILIKGSDCLDIVTVHAYAADGVAVWRKLTQARPRWIPAWFPWPSPSIKQVIEQAGWRGPTWVTETGFSDEAGEDVQARALDQLLERLQGTAWPHGVVYFQLIDDDNSRQGIFRRDQSEKPIAAVLRRYTGQWIG